ncbi:MAG: hypothetical protein ACJAWW_000567 [Sulfurimonas sp.]|jgi:hypothetical protein
MEILHETPENIAELVEQAGLTSDWKSRLLALNALKKYDCPESRDIIVKLALHDKIYKIKEEAFKATRALGITKKGKPIKLGKKNIGYKLEDFTEIFLSIRSDKKMNKFNLNLFKESLKTLNPEMYDVMKYEKSNKFDSWIKTTYNCLPKI